MRSNAASQLAPERVRTRFESKNIYMGSSHWNASRSIPRTRHPRFLFPDGISLVERDHCVSGDIDVWPFTCRRRFQDLHMDRRATGGKTNSSCMRRIWGRICPLTELLAVSKHVFILTFTCVKESNDTWLYHDWSLFLHLAGISLSLRIAIRTKSIWIEMTTVFR